LMKMYWWYMDCYKGIQKQNPSNGYNIYWRRNEKR
jgi:hypothetical protein